MGDDRINMIGIVVVSHDNIALEMVSAAKKIVPDLHAITAVAISNNDPVEASRQKISRAIEEVENGDGILLLSDMFGGTPSNLCLSFLGKSKTEVVSGLNLPMLIKLANFREGKSLEELAEFIQEYGKKNIVIASRVLNGK